MGKCRPRVFFVCFVFFFLLLFYPLSVHAVTVNIISPPSTITDDAFTLTASIAGAATGTNYLRVDIFKDGTNNYFGETFNGSDWYSGSDGKQYLPISVKTGTIWNGQIQARIGSVLQNDYDGSGLYKIRLRRYTSSGGAGSEDSNASAVAISINVPTLTPTPTEIVPTATPPKAPTSTKVPTPTPTKASGPPSKETTPTKRITLIPSKKESDVLGTSSKSAQKKSSPKPTLKTLDFRDGSEKETSLLPTMFICLGGILLTGCGILIFFKHKKNKS